ncbi:MAG: VWA domain-containing protein [Actinobacteria bacterium]|nr:VWA domain-containing protein [Actinomycetota bacterium]
MLDSLQGFVHELRTAGLPVSMTENLDAMRAVEHIDIAEREVFREVLGSTLVKNHRHRRAFDTVFDVYFSLWASSPEDELAATARGELSGGGATGDISPEEIAQMLIDALLNMDRDALQRLAAMAVSKFAGIEPGRPVGGTYYLYRTLRQLDLDALGARMMSQAEPFEGDPLKERFQSEEYERRLRDLREIIETEIRRRLVADRGVEAMARTLRKPLPEDVDFMHASRDEMVSLQRVIVPLTRTLAARLAQRRRRRHRGQLDFRRTVRASLSYGGVPAEPKFRHPHPSKPEIMVVADISGSVASFARFTLQFVYAMASQFSKVRSWVFIDGIDEITRFFDESDDVLEAVQRVNSEADVVWVDGHSDYGHALEIFHDRHLNEVTPKTSIIILGDARNNYHASGSWVLEALGKRAKHVYWLNPEPIGYWDTGDSVIGDYANFCDGVYECRNLRQLQSFVTTVAEG